MYTQCPDCATVFRVTADALRVAHGDVRCGICSTTFNALENLSEQSFDPAESEAAGPFPSPDDSMTVEELPGSENIELSSPPEPAEPSTSDEPDNPAPAASDEDRAMEFHGDAADLDRLFVVETPDAEDFDPAVVAASLSAAGGPAAEDDPDRTDEHPILVIDEQDEEPDAPAESIVLEEEDPAPPYTAPRILIPDEMRKRLAEEAEARAAMAVDFGNEETAESGRRWPWMVSAGALLLLLAAQVVHSNRDRLLRSPGIGPVVAQAYDLLGMPLAIPTDLAAYELRQWGAASDPKEADRLLLRASIVNRAAYAQPYPLLRLALQDRFGTTLGVRDVGPEDYLPGSGRPGLLQPGERADAEIRIVDPGKEAVGFEMDVCIAAGDAVRCANQITTAAQ